MPLTRRQRDILTYLQAQITDNGYAPSFEEIAEHFGFQSLATVHEHLTNLERKGYIRRSYNESRSIEVLPPTRHRGRQRNPGPRPGGRRHPDRGGHARRIARGAERDAADARAQLRPAGAAAIP